MSLHEMQSILWSLDLGVRAEWGYAAATKQISLDTPNRGGSTGGSSFLVSSEWDLGAESCNWGIGQLLQVEEMEISLSILKTRRQVLCYRSPCFPNTMCCPYCAKCYNIFDGLWEVGIFVGD